MLRLLGGYMEDARRLCCCCLEVIRLFSSRGCSRLLGRYLSYRFMYLNIAWALNKLIYHVVG